MEGAAGWDSGIVDKGKNKVHLVKEGSTQSTTVHPHKSGQECEGRCWTPKYLAAGGT